MAKRILPAFLLALGALLLAGAESCSGSRNKETVRPPVNASMHNSPCEADEDCGLVSVDCCECNMGGRQMAVLKSAVKDILAGRRERCSGMMCAAVISTDPSCAMSAKCEDGGCVLERI